MALGAWIWMALSKALEPLAVSLKGSLGITERTSKPTLVRSITDTYQRALQRWTNEQRSLFGGQCARATCIMYLTNERRTVQYQRWYQRWYLLCIMGFGSKKQEHLEQLGAIHRPHYRLPK